MPQDVQFELVTVTPDLAREWLGFNTHNRALRGRKVAAFADDMKAGAWTWNGETIKFADDGTLLDGQNRLHAVILAEAPVQLGVVRGLPRDTQDTMDTGTSRKFSDVLKLHGETEYTTLSAIVRGVYTWERGYRRPKGMGGLPSTSQLLLTLEKHPGLRDIAGPSNHIARGCGLPPSIIGVCWWLFAQIDAEDAEHFFARLADGQHLAKGNPIYELRRAVESSKTVRGERSRTYLMAIVVKAWNAYRDGTAVGVLRFRPGGANPETFPEPH